MSMQRYKEMNYGHLTKKRKENAQEETPTEKARREFYEVVQKDKKEQKERKAKEAREALDDLQKLGPLTTIETEAQRIKRQVEKDKELRNELKKEMEFLDENEIMLRIGQITKKTPEEKKFYYDWIEARVSEMSPKAQKRLAAE